MYKGAIDVTMSIFVIVLMQIAFWFLAGEGDDQVHGVICECLVLGVDVHVTSGDDA